MRAEVLVLDEGGALGADARLVRDMNFVPL